MREPLFQYGCQLHQGAPRRPTIGGGRILGLCPAERHMDRDSLPLAKLLEGWLDHAADEKGSRLGSPLKVGAIPAAVPHHDDLRRLEAERPDGRFRVLGLVLNLEKLEYMGGVRWKRFVTNHGMGRKRGDAR